MPCGDHLGAVFELADFLADADDDQLLASVLAVAPDVVLDERTGHRADGWIIIGRQLRQTAGLCHSGDVDPGVVAIVTGCDGRRTLENVLTEVAGEAELEFAEVRAAAVPIVRRLIEQAFLLPALA